MNVHEFETRIRKKGLRIVKREKYKDYEIFVCCGYCAGDADDSAPHYKTMFAIARSYEDIVLGEFCTVALKNSQLMSANGGPIISPVVNKDDCIKGALERAKQRLDDYRDVQCLT